MKKLLNHPHPLVRKLVRYGRIPLAIVLILGGIAGLFLPILQGVAMITAGVILLAPNSRFSKWTNRKNHRLRARWRLWKYRRRARR